jgi:hypothetical protein
MSKRRIVFGLAAFVLITVLVGQSLSGSGDRGGQRPQRGEQQAQPGGQQPQRGGERPGRGQTMQRNPEQMQEMMLERMKTQLQVTDEKWTTVKPLLKNVSSLNAQLNTRSRGGMAFGSRGGRGETAPGSKGGAEPQPATDTPKTDVEKAADELQTLLRTEAPDADQIKTKLAALRIAKDKVKKDLAKAETDLKAQLTPKQEATLVLMGQLN